MIDEHKSLGCASNVPDMKRTLELLEYLKGKRVAIIGNAASLFDREFGADIDGHDVVVRMNAGLPKTPISQGTRTDIWCFSVLRYFEKIYSRFNARYLVQMTPDQREGINVSDQFCYYDRGHWDGLVTRIGSRPSVGMMVSNFIYNTEVLTASLYGFDWKKTKTFYNRTESKSPHDFEAEKALISEMATERQWSIY